MNPIAVPRRFLFLLIGLVAVLNLSAADDTRIVAFLEAYQDLFSTPLDSDVEDRPGQTWAGAEFAISRGKLRFTVNPELKTVLGGALFLPGEEVARIGITEQLLDVWETHPSMAYAIFTGAVRQAFVYFLSPPTWRITQNDPMERLFLQIDIYKTQAELIRDRLLPAGFVLTPYEKYLLESLEKDGLNSVSLSMEQHSLPVSRVLYNARVEYETSLDDTILRRIIMEVAENLLEDREALPPGSADLSTYPIAVAIHSWLEFTPEMVARVHNRNRVDDPLPFDQILSLESQYAETRQRLESWRIKDLPMMRHMVSEAVTGFENPGN